MSTGLGTAIDVVFVPLYLIFVWSLRTLAPELNRHPISKISAHWSACCQ